MSFMKYNTGVSSYILEYMECRCMSTEHLFKFYIDIEDASVCLEVHLANWLPWYKRIWRGIKYVFGYKSKFGDFDTTIMKDEDINKLIDLLAYFKTLQKNKQIEEEKEEVDYNTQASSPNRTVLKEEHDSSKKSEM